jgi:translation initiation factor 4A
MSRNHTDNIENQTQTENNLKSINSWDDLNINPQLLRGIYAYGFENPSPIQKISIIPILDGKDIIAQAQSGTGKTACFTISSLEMIDLTIRFPQVIIMSPTRELSSQIQKVVDAIGINIKMLTTQLLVGGSSIETDMKLLKDKPPHIIIGCPGRVQDMIKRKYLNTDKIKLVVLDEADEILSAGFTEQIYSIFDYLPKHIQIALFSATIPSSLHGLTEQFMKNPLKIMLKPEQLTLEGIKQYFIKLDDDNMKYETLKDLFSSFTLSQCIIYCNSVRRVSDLYEAMIQDKYPVCQIHSNLDKIERQKNYEQFRLGNSRVLISSNVTARGIDIQQVSTIINFDIPKCVNTYLHRIGRSGRWGRKGVAINFITNIDIHYLKNIETFYNTTIQELPNDYNGN